MRPLNAEAVISSTDASQLLPFIVSKSVIYYNIRYLLTDGHGVQRRGQTFSSGAHIHARRKKAIQSAKKKKAKQKHSNAEFIEEERVVSWKQGSKTKIT